MRRRAPLVITAALAAVGVTAAAITDTAAASTAQQRVVHAVRCNLHPTGAVTAHLTDTLAGLHTLSGSLGTVHVTADGVPRAGTRLNVDAVLHGVTTHGSTSGGTATATVPYSALRRHLGTAAADPSIGTDGTGLTLTVPVASLGLLMTVTTTLTTTATSITLTPTTVSFLGQTRSVSALAKTPGSTGLAASLKPNTITLGRLPAGARLTAARPDQGGLALQLAIPATHHLVSRRAQRQPRTAHSQIGPAPCASS
ncbi:LmeA family phospholipid-binding protein [Streptomyces sp. NPDC004012]